MRDWTGTYTWLLSDFSHLDEDSIMSPKFEIGGHTWQLLLYPAGNNNENVTGHVSVYLELPHASSKPVLKCPSVYFQLTAINRVDANRSCSRAVGYFFTNFSYSWGIHDLISLDKLNEPESGFLVDDQLTVELKMLILDDAPVPSSPPTTAEKLVDSPKRQEIVYLDVGGQPFKIAKNTLARYPDSLLSKMAEEFPELVGKGEQLYIDRNPKAFPWIQEIYRDGDFKTTLPQMSKELLQKELDFYQLPIAEELGIRLSPNTEKNDELHVTPPVVELFCEIMEEIKACNLSDLPEFSIFVYYKRVTAGKEGMRKVFVLPPDKFNCTQCILDRGHKQFDQALHAGSEVFVASECVGGKVITNLMTHESFRIVEISDKAMLSLLNNQASKLGMNITHASFPFGPAGEQTDVGYLKLEYK